MKKAQFIPFPVLIFIFVIILIIGGIMIFIDKMQMNEYCRTCGYRGLTAYNPINSSLIKIECDNTNYIQKQTFRVDYLDKWEEPQSYMTYKIVCEKK